MCDITAHVGIIHPATPTPDARKAAQKNMLITGLPMTPLHLFLLKNASSEQNRYNCIVIVTLIAVVVCVVNNTTEGDITRFGFYPST